MNESEALALMMTLKAAYPREVVSERTVKVYATMLADLDTGTAMAAVKRHVATSRWFPTIAELREAAAETACNLPTPEEAWEEVVGLADTPRTRTVTIRRDDGGQERLEDLEIRDHSCPEFSCPEVRRAVDAIGWEAIRSSKQRSIERTHFLKLFAAYRARTLEQAKAGRLLEPGGAVTRLPEGRRPA